MRFNVLLTRQAERDVDEILDWLTERSPTGARNWMAALEKALDWLEVGAARCALAPENAFFTPEIRQHLFKTRRGKPYRLLFTIAQQHVRVLHLRGPGQDLVR